MHDGRFLIELISGVPVVAAPEEIDMANAAELELALLKAAADGPATLVADLTLTRFCDSSGIRTLLAAHQRARADGSELLLVVSDAAVRRAFTIIGVDRLVPHFTSLDAAVSRSRQRALRLD